MAPAVLTHYVSFIFSLSPIKLATSSACRTQGTLPTPVFWRRPNYLGNRLARSPAGWHQLPIKRSRITLSIFGHFPPESRLCPAAAPRDREPRPPRTRPSASPRLVETQSSLCPGWLALRAAVALAHHVFHVCSPLPRKSALSDPPQPPEPETPSPHPFFDFFLTNWIMR